MSTNHAISSLVSSINNARAISKYTVDFPHTKLVESVLKILLEQGFISEFNVYEKRPKVKYIKIVLKYVRKKSSIQDFKVVSTPGKRIYASPHLLKPYYDNLGFYILSTSKGVLIDSYARSLNVGGEIICKIF